MYNNDYGYGSCCNDKKIFNDNIKKDNKHKITTETALIMIMIILVVIAVEQK